MRALVTPLTLLTLALGIAGCPRRRDGALPYGADTAACATCHEEQAVELGGSAHGRATESPVFSALLPRVDEAWGSAARDRCVGCHAPSHLSEEEGGAGITCVTCHAAIGNRGTGDGALVLDLGAPLDGPFADAEPTPAHASRARGLVSDATLCLTCHDVSGPDLFVEPTAMEHAAAVAAVGAPTCLSCHLPEREPGPIAAGALLDRPRRAHTFVGPTPPAERDAASMAQYAIALRDLFGSGRVLLDLARAPDGSSVLVTLTNAGVGHALPTGVTFLRELRVDLELTHEGGASEVVRAVILLGDRALAGDTEVTLPTDADRIERRRIDPGEAREVSVPIEATVVGVRARVVLRAYRADVLDALGIDASASPEVVVLETILGREG